VAKRIRTQEDVRDGRAGGARVRVLPVTGGGGTGGGPTRWGFPVLRPGLEDLDGSVGVGDLALDGLVGSAAAWEMGLREMGLGHVRPLVTGCGLHRETRETRHGADCRHLLRGWRSERSVLVCERVVDNGR
jgi:hypothetical protein